MNADQYRCVHTACLAMAEQSDSLAVRARWLMLAQDCMGLAKDLLAPRSAGSAHKDSLGACGAISRLSR